MAMGKVRAAGAGLVFLWGALLAVYLLLGDTAPMWLAVGSFVSLVIGVCLVGAANLFERWDGQQPPG